MAPPISRPVEVPIKIAAEVERKGSVIYKLKQFVPAILLLYLGKAIIPYIDALQSGWANQTTLIQKIWFISYNFITIFAERLWLSDILIRKNLELIQTDVSKLTAITLRLEIFVAVFVMYMALFRMKLPFLNIDISLENIICKLINYERDRTGIPFKLLLIFITLPWLYILAQKNGLQNYLPYSGIYTFLKLVINDPRMIFNI